MESHFLQSEYWERFQRSVGRKTWRAAGRLLIQHDLRAGLHYLYSPFPSCGVDSAVFLDEAEKIARQEKSLFLKLDAPVDFVRPENYSYNIQESASKQPRKTVVLDVSLSDEQLLAGMHEKTRYNIRLAERSGVQVTHIMRSSKTEDFETFWNLLEHTAVRDEFRTHEKKYYQALLGADAAPVFSNELFFAHIGGVGLAVSMVNFYSPSGTATYLHGASSRERKEVMAPYLLHWRVIQEARARGLKLYDLWGIDEKKWPGLTRFKMGFGGKVKEYPPALDVVYRPVWYALYKFRTMF